MKKIIFLLILGILACSFISGEILINQQPETLYNPGDIIKTSFKVITSSDFNPDTFFLINVLCNGIETKIMQIPVGDMISGDEKVFNPPIPLLISLLGKTTGTCKIKAVLQSMAGEEYEYVLTNEFEISNLITVELKTNKPEYAPEEEIELEGNAVKQNGKPAKGMVELKVKKGNETLIEKIDTVKNGYFYITFALPEGTKAEVYRLETEVYEVDLNDEKTNQGSAEQDLIIKQVPTNLELIFENQEVEPGTNLKVKGILHDQTGESISSFVNITIKKDETVLTQKEKTTDEFLEFSVNYNEPPAKWKIIGISEGIKSETDCNIQIKEDVKVELINKTLMITNVGNVPYNKTVSVTIGEKAVDVEVFLEIDATQKYSLTAPDGEYAIEVNTDEGNKMSSMAMLTGKAIEVKEAKNGVATILSHPLVWIFVIVILGLVAFLIFKRGHKKIFFGHTPKEKKDKHKEKSVQIDSIVNPKNKLELSLSIKGDKQNASVICLKLKNFREIKSDTSNTKETLQKISDLAEENKAVVYENHDCLFFILAPTKTRTFKNETNAIKIAQSIEGSLKEHNKIFKQPIDFGISLNYGTIIMKKEKDGLKFMSMGTLITSAKKLASISKEEILLGEKINEKLGANVKTEKHLRDKITVYKIKEIKDREANKKFIQKFIKRIEKDDSKK